MLKRLMPRQYGFFDLFERHANTALEGVQTFAKAITKWPDAKDELERITEIEHECDNIAHMTVDLLHRTPQKGLHELGYMAVRCRANDQMHMVTHDVPRDHLNVMRAGRAVQGRPHDSQFGFIGYPL